MAFTNFHTHTTYSLMHSLIKPSEVFLKAKELGQTSIAITDLATLSGAWDSLKYSREAGIKLIIGAEFHFMNDVTAKDDTSRLRHIILLAKNAEGYRNLLALSKEGYENSLLYFKKVIPRLDWSMLEKYKEGLICTTACGGGILSQLINTRKLDDAKKQAIKLKEIFGDNLALEIQPHGMRRTANNYKDYEDQRFTNIQLIKIGDELNIKTIVTTDAHYLNSEDHEGHDVLLAVGSGQPITSGNRLKYTNDFYMMTEQEILERLRKYLGPYKNRSEEFIENTQYFDKLCDDKADWIDPKYYREPGVNWELPAFPVKDQPDYKEFLQWKSGSWSEEKEDVAYLRYWCEKEFKNKFGNLTDDQRKVYVDRLEKELECKIIASYYLIIADFLKWARDNDIPTGSGRGSCGGSLIGYLTGIHEVDPIKYGLIFERFYNKNRKNLGDIDSDISKEGKPLVEEYIVNKYGKNNCAKISNIMMLTPKPYSKAIAKTFMYGGDHKSAIAIGNAIADSIPKDIHTVTKALEEAPLFQEYAKSEKYNHLAKFGKYIGNKPIAKSTHAAGVIICTKDISSICPIRKDKDDVWSVDSEKERAEAQGLVKLDVLGLSTLDIIKDTFKLIKKQNKKEPLIPWDYDENDQKTYELITSGNTYGVFQFGTSGGTVDLCKRLKPKCMEDLALITALTRPGVPKDFRDKFIEARFSGEQVDLIHTSLERSLKKTYGIPVFDECMLTLGADIAGWDLNESDRLRKFIKDKGKHPEKDEQLKIDFVASTIKNGIEPKMANKLWNEMFANFSAYLFNKSLSLFTNIDIYDCNGKFIEIKNIKDIIPGEFVRSRNENTKKEVFVKVKDKHDHGILPLVEIELDSGEKVKCTLNHKFRVKENGEMLPLSQILKEGLSIVVDTATKR